MNIIRMAATNPKRINARIHSILNVRPVTYPRSDPAKTVNRMIKAAIAAFRLFSKTPKTTIKQSVAIEIRIIANNFVSISEITKRAPRKDCKSTNRVPLSRTARGEGSNL